MLLILGKNMPWDGARVLNEAGFQDALRSSKTNQELTMVVFSNTFYFILFFLARINSLETHICTHMRAHHIRLETKGQVTDTN